MFKGVRAVIFDIDGTLTDSVGRIVACIGFACAALGYPRPSEREARAVIGMSLGAAVARILPGRPPEEIARAAAVYRAEYARLERECPVPLFPGTSETLAELKARGYRIAVATGKSRRGCAAILSRPGLAPYVDASAAGDEARSKPDPQMLLRLSDLLAIPPRGLLMVGDSALDVLMGARARARTAGVLTGADDRGTLLRAGAEAVAEDLPGLLALLPGADA